ncbi:cysteine peptidase family C39 domain-containing protein [Terrisporobacter petrolearius]
MTVTNVDDNNFYITDPAKGKYSVSKTKFQLIYNKVGKKL